GGGFVVRAEVNGFGQISYGRSIETTAIIKCTARPEIFPLRGIKLDSFFEVVQPSDDLAGTEFGERLFEEGGRFNSHNQPLLIWVLSPIRRNCGLPARRVLARTRASVECR